MSKKAIKTMLKAAGVDLSNWELYYATLADKRRCIGVTSGVHIKYMRGRHPAMWFTGDYHEAVGPSWSACIEELARKLSGKVPEPPPNKSRDRACGASEGDEFSP